jgi:hypothetical protein
MHITARTRLPGTIPSNEASEPRRDMGANNPNSVCPRLWISYQWIGNEERDFNYLIPQLKAAHIDAVYDSFQLQPDLQLEERIVQRLLSVGFDGWSYILTHQCFTQRNYTEELTAAIDRAISNLGSSFPMAGLMYGIEMQQVPPALRTLPCISLGDPNWSRQMSGVLKTGAVHGRRSTSEKQTRFVWKVHHSFAGDTALTAVEVRTKGERIQYWRFAIPKSSKVVRWGQGRSDGREISRVIFGEAKGAGKYENHDVAWFGAANAVSDTESAYVVFSGPLPDFICFGPAQMPFGSPGKMELLRPNLMP